MVGVVDTRGGNLLSICKAIDYIGEDVELCRTPDDLARAGRVVVPGVGAFGDVMGRLTESGLVEALNDVRNAGTPILGICLGMQMMATRSFEHGEHDGFGWIDGDIVRLVPPDPDLRVPHIGWHDTWHRNDTTLFAGVPDGADLYYVHSYHFVPIDDTVIEAWFDYGTRVVAAVRQDNVTATQFHPEKSQEYGLRILDNFLTWNP